MVNKIKDAPLENTHKEVDIDKEECRHHWLIEVADGPISKGVCKVCGAQREFLNSLSEMTFLKREPRNFELADILGSEPESKRKDTELIGDDAALRV